jgi:hypothetical protein
MLHRNPLRFAGRHDVWFIETERRFFLSFNLAAV